MAMLFAGLPALFGGGAAATTAAAGVGLAGAVPIASGIIGGTASGFSLASILSGTASVLGVLTSIGAGNAEADSLEAQAIDAEREKPIETLQGIQRRASIKRQMADAVGAEKVAYAGSGVDLSFGTASAARTDAYREADLGLTADMGTEQTRISRLSERAASYRSAAKQARMSGVLKGLMGGLDAFSQLKGIG